MLKPESAWASERPIEMPQDDTIKALMAAALTAARSAGASYADVRIGRYRNSFLFTREQQIVNTADTDSIGAGVRALVDGTWGFSATKLMTNDGVAAAAREAEIGRASCRERGERSYVGVACKKNSMGRS